jgi:hypothetical protein
MRKWVKGKNITGIENNKKAVLNYIHSLQRNLMMKLRIAEEAEEEKYY